MSTLDGQTLGQLIRELVAAGRPADTIQSEDDMAMPVEGGYLCRRTDDGLVLTLVSRGEEIAEEHFESESALVETMRRRLLGAPAGRRRTTEEAAADRERMQAKARATLDRLAAHVEVMKEVVPGSPPIALDHELSAAIVGYLRHGSSPSPGADREVAGELVDPVERIVGECLNVPVDWAVLGLGEAGRRAAREVGARYPQLTKDALDALAWNFAFVWR